MKNVVGHGDGLLGFSLTLRLDRWKGERMERKQKGRQHKQTKQKVFGDFILCLLIISQYTTWEEQGKV